MSHIEAIGFNGVPLTILDNLVKEFDAGWVFFYQSTRFLETNDFMDRIGGNWPLFVPRDDSPPTIIFHHRPVEESVTAFKACGDANGEQIAVVSLSKWVDGASVVNAIKAVRRHSSLGLGDAKYVIDECFAGRNPCVTTKDVTMAHELVRELYGLGFVAAVQFRGKESAM